MSLSRRQQLFFDGIEQSFNHIRLTYDRITSAVPFLFTAPVDKSKLEGVTLDAWTVVDIGKRLYSLIMNMPGLAGTPAIELYLRQLASVEDFRHYIQHLDGKTIAVANTSLPLWGWLAFLCRTGDGKIKSAGYHPGRAVTGEYPILNPAGKTFHAAVDHVTLFNLTGEINISELFRHAISLEMPLVTAIKKAEEDGTRNSKGLLRIVIDSLQ